MKFTQLFHIHKQEDSKFSKLAGYENLIKITNRVKNCDAPYNMLSLGGPGSGKTLLLWELREQYGDKGRYYDGSSTTGAGIIDDLKKMDKKPECIMIDEIDKMNKTDQKPLLNLLEGGEVISTKVTKTYRFKIENLKVFASANNEEALRPELLSRFKKFYLKEYTFEQFEKIAIKVSPKLSREIASYIAQVVWTTISHDVRDVIHLGKLVEKKDGPEEINWLIKSFAEYGKPK